MKYIWQPYRKNGLVLVHVSTCRYMLRARTPQYVGGVG